MGLMRADEIGRLPFLEPIPNTIDRFRTAAGTRDGTELPAALGGVRSPAADLSRPTFRQVFVVIGTTKADAKAMAVRVDRLRVSVEKQFSIACMNRAILDTSI
jgi:hypothetical protein